MNVLLSIKPKYVDEILAGEKKYEFRKSIFKKKYINKIFIYSSSPVKKIIASFEIAKIITDSPSNLWEMCQRDAGISEKEFFDYFNSSEIGYAIEICKLHEFSEPINPHLLIKNFTPPQSYCYLRMESCYLPFPQDIRTPTTHLQITASI